MKMDLAEQNKYLYSFVILHVWRLNLETLFLRVCFVTGFKPAAQGIHKHTGAYRVIE